MPPSGEAGSPCGRVFGLVVYDREPLRASVFGNGCMIVSVSNVGGLGGEPPRASGLARVRSRLFVSRDCYAFARNDIGVSMFYNVISVKRGITVSHNSVLRCHFDRCEDNGFCKSGKCLKYARNLTFTFSPSSSYNIVG